VVALRSVLSLEVALRSVLSSEVALRSVLSLGSATLCRVRRPPCWACPSAPLWPAWEWEPRTIDRRIRFCPSPLN